MLAPTSLATSVSNDDPFLLVRFQPKLKSARPNEPATFGVARSLGGSRQAICCLVVGRGLHTVRLSEALWAPL